jgi:LysM repeat protein
MKWILFIIFAFSYNNMFAQSDEIFVSGVAPKNYIKHKVIAKQSWYSIARTFNQNPKDLAAYNKLTIDNGLTIDQVINIPCNVNGKPDSAALSKPYTIVPVFYNVEKGDGLYKIAVMFNTTMQQLRTYNYTPDDKVTLGQKLKVGTIYLWENVTATNVSATTTTPTAPIVTPIVEKPKDPLPIEEKKPETTTKVTEPIKETKVEKVEKIEPAITIAKRNEGFFKPEFEKKGKFDLKIVEGTAATFKTTAGWNDNKFYALIDGVTPGTLMEVTLKSTSQKVVVKVLGEMQEIKQNNGLKIRISNAAASVLGAKSDVFEVVIKY